MSRFLSCSTVLGLALLGCGQAGPAPERVTAADAPIINGSPDNTHQAVVAVLGVDFECSGTIIQVKGSKGYVLTAAHCCVAGDLPTQVVMGADYNNGQVFNVVAGSPLSDPCYQHCPGSTDDVCMLQFSGASAATPVIAPMTSATDALQVGTAITYVGYGITAAPPGGNNSKRRFVQKTIGSVDSYFVDYANASASGTCEGDSGGPGLVTVNGAELVASVTSYGDQACSMLGASIRTSSVYDSFISPYLQDAVPNPSCPASFDCQACSNTAENPQCNLGCAQPVTDCLGDAACAALVQCYQACGTPACVSACNTSNLDGLQKYEGISACLCAGTCQAACDNQLCVSPRCGVKPQPLTCGTCVEDSCCAEAWSCSTDAACKKCFSGGKPAASCATNAAAVAYYQCVEKSCGGKGCTLKDPAGTSTTSSSSATASSSSSAASSGGVGGAGAGSGAGTATSAETTGATTGGGGSVGQKSGCAVVGPADDEAPLTPVAALVIGVAAAATARRRRRSA